MNLYEFKILTFEQQCHVIWNEGKYVAGRTENEFAYNLYSLFHFYVEICFNLSHNTIDEIASFRGIQSLDAYIREINLPVLPM